MPKPIRKRSREQPRYQGLFEAFGLSLNMNGSANAQAEECPFCSGDQFYLNVETGLWDCKHANKCGLSGNADTFVDKMYQSCLEDTTDANLRQLKAKRGWALQTIKRHGIAWDGRYYLLPFKSPEGRVKNLLRYNGNRKLNLPVLRKCLYGLDTVEGGDRILVVCEGPFDAIALDAHLRQCKTRSRYDIIAAPDASTFREEWAKYLADRKVYLFYDNDTAGQKAQQKVLTALDKANLRAEVYGLNWPTEYPEKCDVSDLIADGEKPMEFFREHRHKLERNTKRLVFVRADQVEDEDVEWIWYPYAHLRTYIPLAGPRGHQKSLICKDLAARITAGVPMPNTNDSYGPANVLYLTSEDTKANVKKLVELAGGDLTRLKIHDATDQQEIYNIVTDMEGFKADILEWNAKLVIIDNFNTFAEADIGLDTRARRGLTQPLLYLAKTTDCCIIATQNFGRARNDADKQSQGMGAASMADVSRVAWYVESRAKSKLAKGLTDYPFQLVVSRVSNAPEPKPLHYGTRNRAPDDSQAKSFWRNIVWKPPTKKGNAKR